MDNEAEKTSLTSAASRLVMGRMLSKMYEACEKQKSITCRKLEAMLDETKEQLKLEALCIMESVHGITGVIR